MTKLIGISGSLRRGSFNSALLQAGSGLMPAGAELVIGSIHGIPLYDGDLEAEQGIPDAVSALKDAVADADGLILSTPEYNNSIPGVFKNAIDWLSRPATDINRVFGGKPVAIIGASPGGFGTILSQTAWLPVLRTLGTDFWSEGRLMVARASGVFDANGKLIDPKVEEQLRNFLEGFVDIAAKARDGRGVK
ncbi:MAG: NADPH-dependent FMN reductase [Allorhizobium sp.]